MLIIITPSEIDFLKKVPLYSAVAITYDLQIYSLNGQYTILSIVYRKNCDRTSKRIRSSSTKIGVVLY